MGRPRIHDEKTRGELLVAAERLVAERGIDAVSVRGAAMAAGTTTRAVYVLFGSKEGLVQALAQRAYSLLMERVAAVPLTSDPGRDLVAAAAKGYRAFALEHPDLFRLFLTAQRQRLQLSAESDETRLAALRQLVLRVERAQAAGSLGGHTIEEVTLLWDALCQGLAMREYCGPIDGRHGEQVWTTALTALLVGLGAADQHPGSVATEPVNARTGGGRRRTPARALGT
jgi:AcrR family transcriptional regulator